MLANLYTEKSVEDEKQHEIIFGEKKALEI
jgi:hypothetical protein